MVRLIKSIMLLFACVFLYMTSGCAQVQVGVLSSQGRFDDAVEVAKTSAEAARQQFGEGSPQHADALVVLSDARVRAGNFAAAEESIRAAVTIIKAKSTPDDYNYAKYHCTLASLCESLGNLQDAQKYYREAAFSYNRVLEHRQLTDKKVTSLWYNLSIDLEDLKDQCLKSVLAYANICEQLHQQEEADRAIGEAFSWCEKWNNLGGRISCLGVKAGFFWRRKQFDSAISYYNQAFDLLGREPIDTRGKAYCAIQLARLYVSTGRRASARRLCEGAKKWADFHLDLHPQIAGHVLYQAAFVDAALNNPQTAFQSLLKITPKTRKVRERVLRYGNETEQLDYLSLIQENTNLYINIAIDLPHDTEAAKLSEEIVLATKGGVMHTLLQRRALMLTLNDPQVDSLYNEWRALGKAIANSSGMSSSAPLEKRQKEIERDLARQSGRFLSQKDDVIVSVDDVVRALPPASALIEFVSYQQLQFNNPDLDPGPWRYAAIVVRKTDKNVSTLSTVDIGLESDVALLVQAWRSKLVSDTRSQAVNSSNDSEAMKAFSKRIWQPIQTQIAGCHNIFIAPTGALATVPFGAVINTQTDRYIVEDYNLTYVNTGKDLLGQTATAGKSIYLLGDPDFDAEVQFESNSVVAQKQHRASGMESRDFARLPGTRAEIQEISQMLSRSGKFVNVMVGNSATESAIKNLHRPAMLHFATHGFYESGDIDTSETDKLNRGILAVENPDSALSMPQSYGEAFWRRVKLSSSLNRSAIVLAGANRTMRERSVSEDDGFLTAGEVVTLDLWGTHLVVLSACESGLGEIRAGEGVYGLRRAFTLAGVQNLIMSLWKISDSESKRLMVYMYERIDQGDSPSAALVAAQRRYIAEERRENRWPNPYFWAAFVSSGKGVGAR